MTKRNRLHQIHRWLGAAFPTRKRTRLRMVKRLPGDLRGCRGGYDPVHRIVYVSSGLEWRTAVDVLLHEWAHVIREDWAYSIPENECGHDEFFALIVGVIEKRWNDTGHVESKDH